MILLLALPIRGCKNEVLTPSIIEYDCRKDPTHVQIPETPGIKLKASRCQDYIFTKKNMSAAIKIFASEYSSTFDLPEEEVMSKLSGIIIEVSVIPRTLSNVYDIKGNFHKKPVPILGLAVDKDNIWLEVKTSKIHHSALIHELVHIMIWRQNIVHGDPDHEGDKFSGWKIDHTLLIKRVNNILLDLDI
jgi:hypothetical protein